MKQTKISRVAVLLSLCLLLGGLAVCGTACADTPHPTTTDGVTKIICTNFAGLDFCRSLLSHYTEEGGEGRVELSMLGKEGQDMHSFEPSAADIIALSTADVVISTGAETWLDAALSASGNTEVVRVTMMQVCDTIEEHHDHEHDHDHGEDDCGLIGQDEHVWLSVKNAMLITIAIAESLCTVDADNAAAGEAATDLYLGELVALRADFIAMMEIANRDCVVVADRNPFAYLFRELGLTAEAAFPGCSSETSASFETQTRLVETTRALGLSYIFVMEGSNATVAEAVASMTDTEILTLDSLQVVTDMDKTYIGAMRANLENLKKALQ